MAYIDPEGMFGGDRMGMLSDGARWAWPWFWCASNTVGRVELHYREFVKTAFRQFKKPPTEEQFWEWVSEFHEAFLLFVYEVDGRIWGAWDVSKKYLPDYPLKKDKETPTPNQNDYVVWQERYTDRKKQNVAGKCRVLNVSPKLSKIPQSSPKLSEISGGEERRGEGRSGGDKNPQTPNAAKAAFDGKFELEPPKRRARGKRSTEEIRKALGPRLQWWETFWAIFPCTDSMNPALDAFERRITTAELAKLAIDGARRYAAKVAADPTIKLKYGQGWINDERWTDESTPMVPPLKNGQIPFTYTPPSRKYFDDLAEQDRLRAEQIAREKAEGLQ